MDSLIPHTSFGERGGVSPPVWRRNHRGADAAPLANAVVGVRLNPALGNHT